MVFLTRYPGRRRKASSPWATYSQSYGLKTGGLNKYATNFLDTHLLSGGIATAAARREPVQILRFA